MKLLQEEQVNRFAYWWKPVLSWMTLSTIMFRRVPRQKTILTIYKNGTAKRTYWIEWLDLR